MRHISILLPIVAVLVVPLSSKLHAQEAGTKLEFQFDSSTYKEKGGKSWPGHVTVLMIVRNPSKVRPLYLYGRNKTGTLAMNFDDQDGLSPQFMIATKGSAQISLSKYSVTRGLDAPRIAGTDWIMAEPMPELVLRIDALENLQAADKELKDLFTLGSNEKATGTKKSKKKVPKASLKGECKGAFLIGGKEYPVAFPAELIISDNTGSFALTLNTNFEIAGSQLGLTGADADAKLGIFLTSTSYSTPPAKHAPPKLDKMDEMSDVDLGL